MEATVGYVEWRATISTDPHIALAAALRTLPTAKLQDAYAQLIPGLAAERLNPSESSGDFHLAAGLIQETLFMRKHIPSMEPPP